MQGKMQFWGVKNGMFSFGYIEFGEFMLKLGRSDEQIMGQKV